jgi:hypothetical protein
LSFFDEADEPRTSARTPPRRRRPTGGGRRPPDRQAIQVRRALGAAGILIALILIVLGVHSCQVSQRNSALKDYNNNVSSLVQRSDQTGAQLFHLLTGAQGSSNAASLSTQIDQLRVDAETQLSRARGLDVPSEVTGAQQDFVLALQMRRDGIANIAQEIQPALATSTSKDAINSIAAEMARLYASDAVYKDYTAPMIAAALHGAGIAVGGANGETIAGGQFVPDINWVAPSFVASQLHVAFAPPATAKAAPGVHGHALDSCSVGGIALVVGATNTVPRTPPPTFSCTFTNDGANVETNVVVKASVAGTSISGQAVVPQTTPGQQATAQVTLPSSPPAGTYMVTATVERVPGEKTVTHNSKTYSVTFQ